MAERYKIIPAVFVMVIQDGKILLSRRSNTGWQDGNYGLPAGHGEDRETMREGAAREALEEVGVTIDSSDLELVLVQHGWYNDSHNPHARINFFFAVKKWNGTIENKEPDKCDDLKFFPLDQLPPNTIDHIRAAVESYKRGELYSEFGWKLEG
jgi:ADP-ribose pyrophosphatase YjhB (NUDIX family)